MALRVESRAPSSESAPTRPPRADWLFWGAMLLALVPFAVSAVAVLVNNGGYRAVADLANTELYVRDVGHHAVLVGVPSRYGWFHPGPAFLYVLAVPYHLFGSRSVGLLAGGALMNALAVLGIGLVSRRIAGTRFAVAALAVTVLFAHALGASIVRFPWNPYVAMLPFMLMVLCAWSVALGRVWALPWAVGLGTFAIQSHVGYAAVVVAVLVAGLVGLGWGSRPSRLEPEARVRFRRGLLAAAGVSVAVLAVMWLPPVYQQLTAKHGNLGVLYHYFTNTHPEQTLTSGARTVFRELSVNPPWLTGNWPKPNSFTGAIEWTGTPLVPVLGLVLVAGLVLAVRRRDRLAAALTAIVGVGLVVAVVSVARVTDWIFQYFVMFVPVLGALTALAGAWALWRALPTRVKERAGGAATLAALAGLAFGSIALSVSSADATKVTDLRNARRLEAVGGPLLEAARSFPGRVQVSTDADYYLDTGAVALLLHHGVDAELWPYVTGPSHLESGDRPVTGWIDVVTPSQARDVAARPGCRVVGPLPPLPATPSSGPPVLDARRRAELEQRYGAKAVERFLALSPDQQARFLAALGAGAASEREPLAVVACATPPS